MSQAQGGTEQVITFCELLCDRTRSCARARTRRDRFACEETTQQCFLIIGDRLLPVSHKGTGTLRCQPAAVLSAEMESNQFSSSEKQKQTNTNNHI